jgi:hypothetical protein
MFPGTQVSSSLRYNSNYVILVSRVTTSMELTPTGISSMKTTSIMLLMGIFWLYWDFSDAWATQGLGTFWDENVFYNKSTEWRSEIYMELFPHTGVLIWQLGGHPVLLRPLSHLSLHRVTDLRALVNNSSGVSLLFLFQSPWTSCGLYTCFK